MPVGQFVIAIAAAAIASAAAGEPSKAPVSSAAPPAQAQPPAVLSVQLAQRGETSKPAVPKPRRPARVTTCRCGDPSAQ